MMELNRCGKMNRQQFFAWLNPELPIDEKYAPARLLAECIECDEETWWYFLEILPPMYFTNNHFAICEAATGDIRLAFFKVNGRFFAAYICDHDALRTIGATHERVAVLAEAA